MIEESASLAIYDQGYEVPPGGLAAGTPITLPLSRTYTGEELQVSLNGQETEPVVDFNYVGTAPRTQISFTFELFAGERVRFRIDRAP